MQNNLSLKTYFSLIFHHYPKAHSNLCTSHHWVEIGKVCYSSAFLHTLLYLPKMFFIHLQDTGCSQISSSNSTSCLLSFIHSLNCIHWTRSIFSYLCWCTSPFPTSLSHPSHHSTLPTTIPRPSSLS